MAAPVLFSRLARRTPLLTAPVALAMAAIFAVALNQSHPIRTWLVWDYLQIAAWQSLLCLACTSLGQLLLAKVFRVSFPVAEQWVMSMTLGVVGFVVLMYLGGALHLYGRAFGVGLPLAMIVAGRRATRTEFRRSLGEPLLAGLNSQAWLTRLALGFGVFGATLLYLQCATPDSIHYDATWSHLVIAEDYAREGGIVPFIAETPKNLPHLSSILYTWDFLVPGFTHPAQRWLMAQHTEFLLLVWTLLAVNATAALMLSRSRLNAGWAAFFLFPSYFLYDSNLGAGSDHVAAFFALPLMLSAIRASEKLSPRLCALAGVFGGAALHTKFQCLYLVAPVIALLAVPWALLFYRSLLSRARGEFAPYRANLWLAPLLFGLGIVIGFGPHAITNWVFYRNPVYPLMLGFFKGSTPIFPDLPYDPMQQALAPQALSTRLNTALKLMFTFSFDPQYSFFGNLPQFGSVFTLLIPITLLHARRRRLLVGLLLAQGSVFMWCFVYRVDRNLQLLLPWLAAVTAATIAAAWSTGLIARVSLLPLIGLQIAWGSKFMIAGGADRVRSLINLFSGDLKPGNDSPYDRFRANYRELGEKLPQDATLLLHTAHIQLGINRRTLSDWAGWQYAIDYRKMRTPRDVYLRFRELGITHMVWNNYDFPSLKQEDVLFFAFTRHYAEELPAPSGFRLWQMPKRPPPEVAPFKVVTLGLYGYRDGLYAIDKLGVFEDLPAESKHFPRPDVALARTEHVAASLRRADAALLARNAHPDASASEELDRCFSHEHSYYSGYGGISYSVYLRKLTPECAGLP